MKISFLDAETGETLTRDMTVAEIAELETSAPAPFPFPDPVTVVYSVDIWSRMTGAEADQVGAAMAEQSFRVRKIFETANSYRSDHELWPLLVQIATTLFGEERAAQILAPSQQ